MTEGFELAETLAEVARTLAAESDYEATLDKICELVIDTVDGCQHAGVSIIEGTSVKSLAASDDVPRQVDAVQDEVQEGPCVDAIRKEDIFLTGALNDEDRWPNFSRRASEDSGVQSVLSVRLFAEEETFGAMNLYSKDRDAFDDDDVHVALLFGAHASVAVQAMREHENFRDALASRDLIGRAKGILMARSRVSDDEAFEMLKAASQRMNVKLREVARRIAEGTVPPGAPEE